MKKSKIAIIICSYNQEKLLEICLKSLKKKTLYKNYKVYFVDDSGTGKIAEAIRGKFKWIDVTINKKNLGFAGSNNIGIKKAMKEYKPQYVLLLNDDCEMVDRKWLTKMIDAGEKDKNIGILGCKIIYPDGSLQNIGGLFKKGEIEKILKYKKNSIFEVDHVMGACFLIKKQVIEKIGLLDERYNPYLLEDTDYCLRAKEKGFSIKTVSSATIIHKKGKSIDSQDNKERMRVRFKNEIIFSKRHLKGKEKLFRIFIRMPLVGLFKKKKDTDELKFKNLVLRKEFLRNIMLYLKILVVYLPKRTK
jgi:GT2 family glycosyltransferase